MNIKKTSIIDVLEKYKIHKLLSERKYKNMCKEINLVMVSVLKALIES